MVVEVNMTERQACEVAALVIERGKATKWGWSDEGTAESGPSGGTTVGYRWGKLVVYMSRNGSVYMEQRCKRTDWQGAFHTIWNSRMGLHSTSCEKAAEVRRNLEVLRAGLYN